MTTEWHYPPELREVLATLGLAPSSCTPPAVVRDALNDLYRYELRRLRDRLLAKGIEKPAYAAAVIVLRKKYWPLSMQLAHWETITRPSPAPNADQS